VMSDESAHITAAAAEHREHSRQSTQQHFTVHSSSSQQLRSQTESSTHTATAAAARPHQLSESLSLYRSHIFIIMSAAIERAEDTLKNLERRVSNIELGTAASAPSAGDSERELNAFKIQVLEKLKVIR
jgi:hypothetical protein